MHSTCSDGVLSPKQIIDKAVENDVKIISITDHDSISAYTPEIVKYAEDCGITLIKGIEFSTKFKGVGFHILGYNLDLENALLKEAVDKLKNSRKNYLFDVSKKLEELNYVVDTDKLMTLPSITKSHISTNIVGNSKNKDELLKTFGYIPNKGEFIEAIMNEGCPAYTPKFGIAPKEASEIIRDAGGVVVLAHPVAYVHEDKLSPSEIMEVAFDIDADGIEGNYLYVDSKNVPFDECAFWNEQAKENNFVSTIGSYFHRSDGIRPEIGLSNYILSEENFDKIKELLKI